MSSTLLETTRASHEEVERLERLIVKDLQNEPANNKDRLFQSHRVRNMIENIITTTEKIVEIYEDKDNARKDEIAALGGQTAMGTNVFSAFYDRLKEIREYHRRHPAARVVDANEDYEAMLKEEPVIEFTGEEAFGKYLDMHELYNQFNNLKFEKPIEYSTYLDIFSQPHNLPRKVKFTRQYKEYMENLLEYLAYFFQRTEPLQDLDRILSKVTAEFEEQWENGTVQGWEKNAQENGHVPADHTVIDLDFYSTVEELKEVGPEKLKEALAALGLKSGGTVQQRAERLFLTKHTPLEKLDKKHFVKGSHASELNGGAVNSKRKRHRLTLKVMMTNNRFTIPSSCQWVGMGSLYLIGCINFMVLARNLNARYVGTIVTGVVEHLSGISRNGVISMECVALASQTPRTSMRSHRSRKHKNYGRGYKRGKE
ncbi:SPLICING FACTOR SF3A-RELATED [Salix purpurea]|uniref:SPLICING FACTOR SF3A-RELATED n=1 Tax=Salix purpurea TaxID=77065 RepID=A0A9Q0W5C8_SALPP|nr:SPLICING FACTOR SF3A-RELATED [Salix purpurea]